MNQKPCVVVESQWEDNTYRIQSQNLILFIADGLVSREKEGEREREGEGRGQGEREERRNGKFDNMAGVQTQCLVSRLKKRKIFHFELLYEIFDNKIKHVLILSGLCSG